MNVNRCQSEDELIDAITQGFVGPELAAHVEKCVSCRELYVVSGALLGERRQAITEAPIPSAETLWWRMQMRHRQAAEAVARRSLLIGHAATFIIAMALIASFFGVQLAIGVREAIASIRLSTPLLLALAAWLLLVPVAGYVAIRQK